MLKIILPRRSKVGSTHLKSKGRQDRETVEARGFVNGQVKKEVVAGDEPQD
jgi:hypothetical protein